MVKIQEAEAQIVTRNETGAEPRGIQARRHCGVPRVLATRSSSSGAADKGLATA